MGTNITGIGNANAIGFKSRVTGGAYFPPELKDALVGVWSAYGKSNDSTDRNIIKNKIKDRGGDFVISNAAFKLNSGYGLYGMDFLDWKSNSGMNFTSTKLTSTKPNLSGGWLTFRNVSGLIPETKVKVSGAPREFVFIGNNGADDKFSVTINNGVYTIPEFTLSSASGFYIINNSGDWSNLVIEQIPSFEGAFVTDGINDLITSTKTVQEMGITDEITVVSMIHKISSDNNWSNLIGELKGDHTFVANRGINTDKTGIYGYTYNYNENAIVINNILGDKNDYIVRTSTSLGLDNKYYVTGFRSAGIIQNISQIAWYWTFIANRVLTTDEINQVIAYYNLDRTLRPDILCNITKQGITNDNHADFNDKLIDYSGNGRDIQMNNLAWKGGSGIAAKPFETIKDYTIVSDEARQKLTIYNEFSYKVKSNTPNHYWIVQSIIKDNTSYQVTIITDKDCYWINSTSFINNEGNKESIRKEYPVKANTLTQVTICGLNEFEYPEGIEPTTAVSYVNLEYAGEVTVTFIPSCKGGLLLDGVNDFGKVTGLPIYKDYTVIADYERTDIGNIEGVGTSPVLSKSYTAGRGSFVMNFIASTGNSIRSYSFGTENTSNFNDLARQIFYQSKYKNQGFDITAGTGVDGDSLWLGTARDNDSRFFNGAIYSLMSFPYSMSEFLIERQLKKHKLGTLYPDMVEFRPVIKSNASYSNIVFYYKNEKVENGTYLTVGSSIGMHIRLSSSPVNEIKSITVNGIPATFKYHDANSNIYQYDFNLTSKSPQKINITIDEYIRYEDIVQPYPVLLRFKDENGNEVSWGGKFRVGSTITRIGSAADSNLLPNIYDIFGLLLNGNQVTSSKVIVEKTMVFKAKSAYIFDNNEPKCILSPRLLRIPNSSYKILGYIPDISGHGNHGVIHNSVYAKGSGVNEDGSYQFDGVDDFVAIPTLSSGGKQVLMKTNWLKSPTLLYDQRASGSFAILTTKEDDATNPRIAYQAHNQDGKTYIDGIENNYIETYSLKGITHNITVTNPSAGSGVVPVIGANTGKSSSFAKMALYDFMLFDEVSTDEEIKQLNDIVGIEGGYVQKPPYYWDAYGKTNSDDRSTIQQRGVAVGDYDLTNTNFAYDKMSGFGGYTLGKFTNSWSLSNNSNSISIVARNPYDITLKKLGGNSDWEFNTTELKLTSNPVSVKFKSDKNIRFTCDYHYYTVGGNSEGAPLGITSKDLIANEDTIITISPISQENIDKYNIDINRGYYLIYFQLSPTLAVNEEVTIEMLPLYPNGLVYDGVDDYSENTSIPAFTDYTYIFKRTLLNKKYNSASVFKGSNQQSGGGAFICDYNSVEPELMIQGYSFGAGLYANSLNTNDIVYGTRNSVNGQTITSGNNADTEGLTIGKWRAYKQMVFYKLMLYPRTTDMLTINMIKNMMAEDGIIDIQGKLFTDKYTGDFNLDFNKDFLIGN